MLTRGNCSHFHSFVNILILLPDELSCYNCDSLSEEEIEKLGDLNTPINVDNEEKVWKFLETRLSLLLRAYDTSVEVWMTCMIQSKLQYCY